MAFLSRSAWLGFVGSLIGGFTTAVAAVGGPAHERIAAADRTEARANSVDVELRFIQEDGPRSGHVRVVLTPETRSLNAFEARSAAEQAFLTTLDEPGLGAKVSRITVVVKLHPGSPTHAGAAEQVILFHHKGGGDWSIRRGE